MTSSNILSELISQSRSYIYAKLFPLRAEFVAKCHIRQNNGKHHAQRKKKTIVNLFSLKYFIDECL